MKNFNLQTPEVQEKIRMIESDYNSNKTNAFELTKELMAEAVATGNSLVCGFCHAYLARYYYIKGDLKECMSHIRAGLKVQEANEDYDSISISYNLLGIDAMNHGEYPIALDYYENALDAHEPGKSVSGAALVNIGHIYYEVGDFNKALSYCKRGRTILEKEDHPYSLLVELAQEATYNIWSKRLVKAREVMQELSDLEDRLRQKYPDEIFTDLYEVQIYYYDTVQEPEKRDQAFRTYIDALGRYDGSFIDYSENINWICDTLFNSGKLDFVGDLLDLTRDSVMDSGIPFMQLQFLERDVKYHKRIGDDEQVHLLESKYFQLSCIKNREDLRIYRTNISIHNDLNSLKEEKDRVEEENRQLLKAASIDPLTQIANRALLNQKAEFFFQMAAREHASLGVEMLDVDFFKEFNDTYGHQEGDRCLQLVASILDALSSDNIFVARYGGDEFMVIYYDMTDDDILKKAELIRDTVSQMHIKNEHSKTTGFLSVSQGIRNSVPKPGNRVWDYTYGADNALYKVKKTQKGNIVLLHSVAFNESVLKDAINE